MLTDTETVKLHLGCGSRYLPGYMHIDQRVFDHIDHQAAIFPLPMIADNSASMIYASHCFEYFDRETAVDVLREWRRCLQPGGILRLAVPWFERLVELYLETGEIQRVLGPLYGRWPTENGEHIYHKTTYDVNALTQLLNDNGFAEIEEWDWRLELPEDYDDYCRSYYPHMDFDGLLISLNLQATKTST